jgi:signal peptidase I
VSDRITAPQAAAPGRPHRARWYLLEIVETLVLTIVIFVGIQTFVAQPYKVEQRSMQATLQPGEYVLVDKLTPRWAPYARGDIVVFDPPATFAAETHGVPLIKRVIGLPGDHLELRDGKVIVNGTALAEPYLYRGTDGATESTDPRTETADWVVPDGSLFVMGDHRQDSSDSRIFGPIEIAHVIGRAWLRYWPLGAFGVLERPTYLSGGA